MAAIVELVPMTRITDPTWTQPLDSIVDVSAYTQAAIVVQVPNCTSSGGDGTRAITILTALENREEHYIWLAERTFATAVPFEPQLYFYLAGASKPYGLVNDEPGFGRYLRISVSQPSGKEATVGVKAVLKP